VQRTPEEKWQIVLEGLKSGIVAETCRKYEIAPNLYYGWKDEVEAGAKAALGGEAQSQHPGRALTGGRSERVIHLRVDHWPHHYSHCFPRFLQNGELRSNSGATPSLVLYRT